MRYYLKNIFILTLALLLCQEAWVSEVFMTKSKETLESAVRLSQHLVIVKPGKVKIELFRKVVFPKETHYAKKQETLYQEHIEIYQVKTVISSSKIKIGEIKVFTPPDYNEFMIQDYHEHNRTESPIVKKYQAVNKPNDQLERILLLQNYPKHPDVYILHAIEGINSLKQIKTILSTPSRSKKPL